jgi:DNA-directed DNA polymerase III PolC
VLDYLPVPFDNAPTVKPEFVHLHVHSDYSFLDGACKTHDLVKKVSGLGMKACALTDHGNMLGAIEFYDAAMKAGVKPILGIEAYIAPGSRLDRKEVKGLKEPAHHLTLLVKNEKGYRNLLKLTSSSFREGFYYKPRMDKELLSKYHEGLIALSGCPNSEFGRACKTDQADKALKAADDYRQIFGPENFYLEVQSHGLDDEQKIQEGAAAAARDLGLKVVATNDAHYMARDDAKAHDALLALSTGRLLSDTDRLRYPSPEFYIKSPDEMVQAFPHFPEGLRASVEIADKCNLELRFNEIHLPVFDLPVGTAKAIDYLRELCVKGAREKYGDPIPDAVSKRMDYELSVMEKMGFASYFLIVWDLRRFARENGVRVGPGRGSAAGSLVGFVLGITSIDPLRYDLIFERFLNPSRKEMPDIDLDFSNEDRGRVIEYIFEKYGHDKVAQIITYGTMKARAVLRDVGRVLAIDLKRVDQIAKKIPKVLDITLHDAARMEPELQKEIDQDPQVKELWEIALRLEGNARHAGKHASGVVICDRPLEEIVPLYTLEDAVMTQYDMNAVAKLGILKIDILGLETLTVLDRAVKLIEQTKSIKIDLQKIPLDDRETYTMLGRGTVKGVFQLETSRGMRELVQKMKPDRIEDLIATIALFRPGPLQSGMVDQYIRCKHGLEAIKPIHPVIDPILAETNGVILYQEQVMRIANVMAGFSMADADGLRKAMGKKIPEIMAKYKEQFVKGAVKNGVKEELAVQVFDLMAYFAGYGFNKCLVGSTMLVDALTGERTAIESLFRDRRPFQVHALGEDLRLRPREVLDVVWNGPRPVFEVRTALRNRITATGNHPFRCPTGWKNLEELRPGDRVASLRHVTTRPEPITAAPPWGPGSPVHGGLSITTSGPVTTATAIRSTVTPTPDSFRPEISWDRILSIEPRGIQDTYDLEVDVDHNFVADGLIVHNSHSAAYGIVSYQTAYLKAKWPVEYMAALMSCAMGNTDKLAEYIEECRQLGIEVLPPDLNESELDFKVVEKKIRFGLGAVKGAGEKAIQHIVEIRHNVGRFQSVYQFCENVDPKFTDRKVLEQLVKCGAFDSTGGHRAQIFEAVDQAVRIGSAKQADRKIGQLSIFDTMGAAETPALPDVPEWPQETLLTYEKDVLGCYVTSNPVLRYEEVIKNLSTTTVDRMPDLQDGQEVTMGGIISGLKAMIQKTGKNAGQKYVMFKFSDLSGTCEGVCFAGDFDRNRDHLFNDAIVFISGRVGFRNETPSLRASTVTPIEKAREVLSGSVRLAVSSAGLEKDLLLQLQDVIRAHPGPCPVFFEIETPQGHKVLVKTQNEHFVSPSGQFLADIEEVLGTGHVRVMGKPTR